MTRFFGRRGSSLPIALLVVAAFVCGSLMERTGWLPGSNYQQLAGVGHVFDPFWETWYLVKTRYVDRKAVQPERMTQGAIEGMLDTLGDVGHTSYLNPDAFKRLQQSLKGELDGIGARVTLRHQRTTIIQTMPNSPARAAGLHPGDAIIEVDGKSVAGLSLDRVVDEVRGPAGSKVHLRLLRPGQSKPMEVEITRARVSVPEVLWQKLPGAPLAQVAIYSFGNATDEQLRAALDQARQQGVEGVILDLRGNFGGLKDEAVAVASEFLKSGVVFLEQNAQGNRQEIMVRPGGVATDLPLCVLIDNGTASASEIFAGAIQDHHRAKLVGTRTFGTGTVLQPYRLSDGSAVLLAVSEWLTPDGRQIWHQGIKPDVEVTMPEDAAPSMPESEAGLSAKQLAESSDQPLKKAMEILKQQLKQEPTPTHG